MKFLKKNLIAMLIALGFTGVSMGADYGLPANIQDGNILHCFNWPASEVKAALPQIAAAGFGSVQLSPLQRGDVKATGTSWHDLYRPYDMAFKSSSFCSESDLQSLCAEAANYGIKVIVDVVANHVDRTAGYHDTWWDSNGRIRWNGTINYGDRYSITHGQLGDYGDINSELAEVCARGKAYVEKLKSLGVKGCRWDAAKHIGLPSESCNFWSSVASVSGMWHYGEILDSPGPNSSIIKEYAQYMSVTDNRYANGAAQGNGGICNGYGGEWVVNQGLASSKLVYWAESHDTYSNDEWSQNVDQATIDRAYACMACRNGAACLYLSRPNAKGFNNIKTGKGSTAFTGKHIAEVNKFRNAAGSAADYCTCAGNAFSCTRKGFGAVIVMKGSGNVSIANGGGYCPAGTYTDKVSGGKFTVTASTISGTVGSSGIAVIDNGTVNPTPGPDDPDPVDPTPTGDMWILGNLTTGGWGTTPGSGAAMTLTGGKYVAKGVSFKVASGETKCYFNITDYVGTTWDDLNMNANRYGAATEGAAITLGTPATVVKYTNNVDASACKSWTVAAGTYDITLDLSSMKITLVNAGESPVDPDPVDPDPVDPTPTTLTITGDYNLCYSGSKSKVYYWGGSSKPDWPGVAMTTVTGSDGKSYKVAKVASGTTSVIFNSNGDSDKTGDLTYSGSKVMTDNGPSSTDVVFKTGGDEPVNPPTPGSTYTVYFNNEGNWSDVYAYCWDDNNQEAKAFSGAWPGKKLTETVMNGSTKLYKFSFDYSGTLKNAQIIFHDNKNGSNKSSDLAFVNNGIYKVSGKVGDFGGDDPTPTKPVVTATPASGTSFSSTLSVSLSVSPATDIYYTLDGTTPSAASTKYTGAITLTATTTLKTFVTNAGGSNVQTFTYTKSDNPNPPTPPTPSGKTLNTNYYKVNPNGQCGRERTVNMQFQKEQTNRMCQAVNAMSNWTEQDLICQGVARDIASGIRGKHEYPVNDSYAIYAAYDDDNLYLGVQYVYSVWDLYGDGKDNNGRAKPYQMDGRLMLAFDLDPNKSFAGVLANGNTIWDADGQYNTFDNGVDCIWLGSSKSTVGTPGLFFPDANGNASYDAAYCKGLDAPFYGCYDGLLPSIQHVWGYKDFGYDPEVLKGNDGFVDLRTEVGDDLHTFYEWEFPLSKLGITKDHIKNTGIGVMVIDTYGQGAIGCTPYDPTVFDNANKPYSKDEATSMEKEDKDIFTYSLARIGKYISSDVENVEMTMEAEGAAEYYTLDGIRVMNPEKGIYLIRQGGKVSKKVIK